MASGSSSPRTDSSLPQSDSDQRIVLNVGGIKYETFISTLTKYPDTLLGTMFHPRNAAMVKPTPGTQNEYFFDRDGHAFRFIMEFYRTGSHSYRALDHFRPGGASETTIGRAGVSETKPHPSNPNTSEAVASGKVSPTPSMPLTFSIVTRQMLAGELDYFQIPQYPNSETAQSLTTSLAVMTVNSFLSAIEEILIEGFSLLKPQIQIFFFRDGQDPFVAYGEVRKTDDRLHEFTFNGYDIINNFEAPVNKYFLKVFPCLSNCHIWKGNLPYPNGDQVVRVTFSAVLERVLGSGSKLG